MTDVFAAVERLRIGASASCSDLVSRAVIQASVDADAKDVRDRLELLQRLVDQVIVVWTDDVDNGEVPDEAEVREWLDNARRVNVKADPIRAERDELRAEIAAYQGRPEGALNDRWTWEGRYWLRAITSASAPAHPNHTGAATLHAHASSWCVYVYGALRDAPVVHKGNADGWKANARAAEAKARELGLSCPTSSSN